MGQGYSNMNSPKATAADSKNDSFATATANSAKVSSNS